MFGIGMPEMLLILALALIIIGPKKLPDLAKSLGRTMREFKKATNDLKDTIQLESELSEVKETFNDISDEVKSTVDLHLDPETKKTNETETAEKKNEGHDDQDKSESGDFSNLQNLKKEFDNLETKTESPQDDETGMKDPSPGADDDKKDNVKGPLDDA